MVGAYKRSKFLAEEAVRRLIVEDGLPIVIVNPSAPIGPRDIKPTPTGKMIVDAAAGRMPAYVDTGLNVAHVDDVAAGHLLALEKGVPGQRYILGGEDMTLRDILGVVCRHAGRRPPRVKLPHELLLPMAYGAEAVARVFAREPLFTVDSIRMARKRMFFSCEKAKKSLGYAPRPAAEAICDAVDWYRAQGYLG
jgi:dihydroflavonol-4-reductase